MKSGLRRSGGSAGRVAGAVSQTLLAILIVALPSLAQPPHSWTLSGSLNTARAIHAAATLPNGQALIVGGVDSSGIPLTSGEIFNLSGKNFTTLPSGLASAVSGLTATVLADSTVLLAGGIDSSGNPVAAAELYDPSQSKFTPLPSMSAARSHHTATLLNDGTVLFAGGEGPSGQLTS